MPVGQSTTPGRAVCQHGLASDRLVGTNERPDSAGQGADGRAGDVGLGVWSDRLLIEPMLHGLKYILHVHICRVLSAGANRHTFLMALTLGPDKHPVISPRTVT